MVKSVLAVIPLHQLLVCVLEKARGVHGAALPLARPQGLVLDYQRPVLFHVLLQHPLPGGNRLPCGNGTGDPGHQVLHLSSVSGSMLDSEEAGKAWMPAVLPVRGDHEPPPYLLPLLQHPVA